jgi:hypothetical protein
MNPFTSGAMRLVTLTLLLLLTSLCSLGQTPAKQASVEGTYDAELTAEGQGTTPFTLIIKREGEKLTAQSKGSENLSISGIKVDGENVTLYAAWQGNAFEMPGKLTEGGMQGKWEGGSYGGPWSAKKQAQKK